MFWSSRFCITLELSGPRQRLRLNDLLYAPLILTLNLCFDLFGTEPAEHYRPVCTALTTDFCDQPKSDFVKSKTYLEIQPPRRNRQNEVTSIFCLLQKPPTEITTSKNNPRNRIFTNPETSKPGFRVLTFGVSYNAGVKRPASAGPLEWLVMRAFVFGCELLFWPFWHRTTRASLPGLHNAHYRFLNQSKLCIFETQKNRLPFEADKLTLPPISPTPKTTHWNCHPKRTTHEIEFSLNQEPIDLDFHVLIFSVLHNAGVKRAASAAPLERLVMWFFADSNARIRNVAALAA